jgi:NhaP-type Na+/H+ and K+/H+ antiporter
MTILGKILVFFVLFLSLVWTGLTVNAFATRTNYKAALDDATAKIKVAVDGANQQAKYSETADNATKVLIQQLTEENKRLAQNVKTVSAERDKANAALNDKNVAQQNDDEKMRALQTERDKLVNQVKVLSDNQVAMEKSVNDSTLAAQKAKDAQLQAELDKAAAERARDDAITQRNKLENRGSVLAIAPPVPEGFRATVVSVSGDQVEISLGAGANLGKGSVLDISRTTPEARYVGRLVITSVQPYSATGRFVPRAGVRAASGDDLPRAGDTVSVISTNR